MHPEKMKRILALDDAKRLEYFVAACAESGKVWGLRDKEGWCGMGTSENTDAIPFWPEEVFAVFMAEESWADSYPESVPLREFMEEWLPGMERDGVLAAVFPIFDATPTGMSALAVSGNHLRDLLREESDKCGGVPPRKG